MKKKLQYLSNEVLSDLYSSIDQNMDRYVSGDFMDLSDHAGWSIDLRFEVDFSALDSLDATKSDIDNSLVVWDSLKHLPPSLATEDVIWSRLSHIECLQYSRDRWIKEHNSRSVDNIKKHFFAGNLTGYRDDHAISRLWWSAYIANKAYPDNPKLALEQIFKTADIRSNIIERPWIGTRIKVLGGIIRAMMEDPWLTDKEINFRQFMKNVNKFGGGLVFEVMNDNEIDDFILSCYKTLKK